MSTSNIKLKLLLYLSFFAIQAHAQIVINEVCASNSQVILDDFGQSSDWIELYNTSNTDISIKGWFITDNLNDFQKWRIPDVSIPANGYQLIFANNEDTWLQLPSTNFKLSSAGETISLSSNDSFIVDQIAYPSLPTDQSFGRIPDGSSNWQQTSVPTPLVSNTSIPLLERVAAPSYFGITRFFDTPKSIRLQAIPNATIYYTENGDIPTINSQLYSNSLYLNESKVIKAIAVVPGHLPSKMSTFTFFIGVEHELPIISLSSSPYNFSDIDVGILIRGENADEAWPYWGANFWSDKEVPVFMEYFEDHQTLAFANQFDTQVHGGRGARTNNQKPLRLEVKNKYGAFTVSYPFFKDRDRTTYKRLVLRNASGDYNTAHFRDAFLARYFIKEGLNLDVLAYQPATIYINGDYYGIINMREKSDKYYLAHNYGVDIDNLDLLEEDTLVNVGNYVIFDSMYQFVFTNDLSIDENYQKATTFFDVENIAETFIVELGLNNNDWLGNNIKYWRERKENARWRYLVFDMDIAMGRHSWTTYDYNLLAEKMADPGTNRHVNIFKALIKNTTFRNYFLNRHADLLNTIFRKDAFSKEIDETVNQLDFDIQQHFSRWSWNSCGYPCWGEDHLPVLYDYVENRPTHARKHLIEYFDLEKEVELSINTFPEGAGKIKINTITPELPWNGMYFDGVPVTISIEPNPGFRFDYWHSPNTFPENNESLTFTQNFSSDDEIIAFFENEAPDLAIISAKCSPNSTLDITLDLTNPTQIELQVYDASGKLIHFMSPTHFNGGRQRRSIAIPGIAAGLYILQVSNETTREVAKFVVGVD